jgi:hypothetical protein
VPASHHRYSFQYRQNRALNDPVAIVHIPIHLDESVATTMYGTVDSAPGLSNEFFNVTSNAVEVRYPFNSAVLTAKFPNSLQIAVFARTDLVNRYWAERADENIKISSTWRVFEISSGDQGETNNYGESGDLRSMERSLVEKNTHSDTRFSTSATCVCATIESWNIHSVPIELFHRFLAGQGIGLQEGFSDLCRARM